MLQDELNHAFDKIYRTFNRSGRSIARDQERHPEYTRRLLDAIGAPDRGARNILVTGSKGKGSTAYFIARLAETLHPRIGLFTSPHLLDSLERIRVNQMMISEAAFADAFRAIEPHLDRVEATLPEERYVGPVGIFAVLAAWYFARRNTVWNVYETGRGARFDDVAQLHHRTAVITSVLLEHVKELGPSLRDIAWHKAGAISPKTDLVVLGSRSPEIDAAVSQRIAELHIFPKVLDASKMAAIRDLDFGPWGTRFTLEFADGRHWPDLRMPMVGRLVENLRTAVAVVEATMGRLDPIVVRTVLDEAVWPGRGEIVSTDPLVLLDAGVRPESLKPLLEDFPAFDAAVLSVPDGKDRHGMTELLAQHAQAVIWTTCSNPRLSYQLAQDPGVAVTQIIPDVGDALAAVLRQPRTGSRILLCGTMSFVADVYRWLGRRVG